MSLAKEDAAVHLSPMAMNPTRWAALAFGLVVTLSWATPSARGAGPEAPPPEAVQEKSARTGIQLAVTPEDVVVFIDGEERGKAGELSFIATRPGKHSVRLVRGGDEVQAEIPVEKGQIVEFRYDFE